MRSASMTFAGSLPFCLSGCTSTIARLYFFLTPAGVSISWIPHGVHRSSGHIVCDPTRTTKAHS